MTKQYLGYGVYADVEGECVKLTTENGICVENTIYLDPQVVQSLLAFLEELVVHSCSQTKGE